MAERIGDRERVVARALEPAHRARPRSGTSARAGEDSRRRAGSPRSSDSRRSSGRFARQQAMLALAAGRLAERRSSSPRLRARRDGRARDGDPRLSAPAVHALRLPRRARGARSSRRYLTGRRLARAPVFRCVLALICTRGSDWRADAQRVLDDLAARRFLGSAVRSGVALRHEPARGDVRTARGRRRSAAVLYELARSLGSLNAADRPRGSAGSVARYLGLLGDDDSGAGRRQNRTSTTRSG